MPIITGFLTSDRNQLAPASYYRLLNQRSYSASPVPIITDLLTRVRCQLARFLLLHIS
jgi:hypothetical protein